MTVAEKVAVPPRVRVIAGVLRRFSREELAQLVELVPALKEVGGSVALRGIVPEHFRKQLLEMRGEVAPSPDEEFIGGLTYGEYLKLSEEEEERFWEKLFSEGEVEIDEIEEHD